MGERTISNMNFNKIRFLNHFFYIFLFRLASLIIPRRIQPCFTKPIGWLFYKIMKRSRDNIIKNMEIIGVEKKDLKRKAIKTFQNYGQYLLDYMVMDRINKKNIHKYLSKEIGRENIINVLKKGKGAICLSIHLGNWELGGLVLAFQGVSLNVLSLREENNKINKFREKIREKNGIKVIYVEPEKDMLTAIIEIKKLLSMNQIIAMLGDRPTGSQLINIPFFGKECAFPAGAAYLSYVTGAPILPVFVLLDKDNRYKAIMEKPINISNKTDEKEKNIREGMEKIVKIFEKYIAQYPEQWYNFFPYFEKVD
ncbi:MAG: lysophospholipid acyltransferase family protein [Deltaproteobacteria bacterium]|nr:lysophospholipid acyltransferase family protein [Deltaproteobacteria bacterium]